MNNNLKVIIDAGHGGSDPGAVSGNLKEKDLSLQASKYMEKRLNELGIPTFMTRDDDSSLPKDERITKILNALNGQPAILVANHINAGGGEGAEIVYALRNQPTLAQLALDNIGEKGQIKRKAYQRRLPENPNLDYYYILRESGVNTEPILVEYGFIDNENDRNKLINKLNDYVEGVVQAIAEYTNTPYSPPETEDFYIVKKGDTLYKIANDYNITVQALKDINNLVTDTIEVGQKLFLKSEQTTPKTYIVKKGDTLYSIATAFNTTPNKIKQENNIQGNTIYIGQELKLPSPILPPTSPPITEDPGNEIYTIYTVKKGDSLWSISREYNISVQELIDINDLLTTTIKVGDQLKVPAELNEEIYVVKPGDTLWSIAKKNNITVDDLKNKNNLSSNLLSINQQLIIPKQKEVI